MAKDTVILIHGLWMNGMDLQFLKRRFSDNGYQTAGFRYDSTGLTPSENGQRLIEFIASYPASVCHFICHSLGGLILRHCLHDYTGDHIGRSVMLGTPNQPSTAAAVFKNWPFGKALLGDSLHGGLSGQAPPWNAGYELGVIAGNMRFGMGMVIPDIPIPNDGTVSVEETRLDGMRDHIVLHVSHFGLLLSKAVYIQIQHFLQYGEFRHH